MTKKLASTLDEAMQFGRADNTSLRTPKDAIRSGQPAMQTLKQRHQTDLCMAQQYVYVGEGLCMRHKRYYVVQQTFNLGRHYHQVRVAVW